jgi:hypothetical protein
MKILNTAAETTAPQRGELLAAASHRHCVPEIVTEDKTEKRATLTLQ